VDLKKLSERGVAIFFTQVFRDSFFHADMHPGNIFVDATDPADPRYIAIDFGIIGTLSPVDQHYLAENFLAFFRRDYRRVAELHIESGWVPRDTRVDEFESAIRTVCEPIFDRPLREISFGGFLLTLFQTARRFNMEVQPQLVLLQKTLLNIEGIGRQLYPDLDLWVTAQPFLRKWYAERMSPRGLLKDWRRHGPEIFEAAKALPLLARRMIVDAQTREYLVRTDMPRIESLRAELQATGARRDRTIVACAALLAGVVWFGLDAEPAWAGLVVAGLATLYLALRR